MIMSLFLQTKEFSKPNPST
uniref:Uncharacterized protein n=1 Tax=Rhizophora mucronata TaxID=61149 RepID=A0A2P2NTT2_RHIMU